MSQTVPCLLHVTLGGGIGGGVGLLGCRFLGITPALLNNSLRGWGAGIYILTNSPGVASPHYPFRICSPGCTLYLSEDSAVSSRFFFFFACRQSKITTLLKALLSGLTSGTFSTLARCLTSELISVLHCSVYWLQMGSAMLRSVSVRVEASLLF